MKKSKKIINKKKSKKTLNKRRFNKTKRRKTKRRKTKRQKIKKYRGGVNHSSPGTNYNGEGYYKDQDFIKHGRGTYERMINGIRWVITGDWNQNKLMNQTLLLEKYRTPQSPYYTYGGDGSYDDDEDKLLIKDGYGMEKIVDIDGGETTIRGNWHGEIIRDSKIDYTYKTQHMPLKKRQFSGRGSYVDGKISRSDGYGTQFYFKEIADEIPMYEYEGMWDDDIIIEEMIVTIRDVERSKTRRYKIVFDENTNIITEISLFEGEWADASAKEHFRKGLLTSETNNISDLDMEKPLTFLDKIKFTKEYYTELEDYTNMQIHHPSAELVNAGQENRAPWVGRA